MRKSITAICLFLIFCLALFFRVYFCYEKVMGEPVNPHTNSIGVGVKYVADDGVYHMRIVENMLLGKHFPHRIYFDPYTYFPYGTYIHFAPLYTWLLAVPVWVISAGKPTLSLINKIVPFIPPILGSLTIFVAYFIAKALFGKKTGLLAALLMAISSPYLFRSLLGATDHHVAETLFSGLAMMFLIFALKTKKTTPEKKKTFWLYTILAGISMGLYFLSWTGALIFVFIVGCFIVLYYLVECCTKQSVLDSSDYSRSRSNNNIEGYSSTKLSDLSRRARGEILQQNPNWILKAGALIFLIPLVMILPFFGHPDIFHSPLYNISHLVSLTLGAVGFIFIGWLGTFIKKKKWPPYFLPVILVLLAVLFLLIIKLALPDFFTRLSGALKAVNQGMVGRPVAREVISEMRPLILAGAISDFSALFYLAIISLIIIAYRFIKKRKTEDLLFIIWTLTILLLTGIIPAFGQQRNTYYLALNISILAAFLIIKGLKFGWQGIKIAKDTPRSFKSRPYLMFGSIAIVFIMLLALLFPFPINIANSYPQNLPQIFLTAIQTAKTGPTGPPSDQTNWYEVATWLKNNTPEPNLNYFELYQEPGINKATDQINPYPYPKEAYGILTRWDVGHIITYYSHRIPNANPFQQGLGEIKPAENRQPATTSEMLAGVGIQAGPPQSESLGGEDIVIPGESVFFIEEDEAKATQYLDALKTKYVITDSEISNANAVFKNFIKWLGINAEDYYLKPGQTQTTPSKFDRSMVARLHLLDGTSMTKGGEIVRPLDHFRLIYESAQTAGFSRDEEKTEIKTIKIFEYVKGAKISGRAPANSIVSLSTNIKTNQGRIFVYEKDIQTSTDGRFEFIVPYSTLGPAGRLPGQTKFDVFASPYKIKIGQRKMEVNVTENDVLEGGAVKIN